MFKKYQHVERLESDEVSGLLNGTCYIFPKIDGTNGSIWLDPESKNVHAGSRKRCLVGEKDNFDFYTNYILQKHYEEFSEFFLECPNLRLFGEYLISHSLKTYRDDAWHKFYIFDVFSDSEESYLHYDEYIQYLAPFDFEVIPPLAIVENPVQEDLYRVLENNTYLIKDGEGLGEGIVIKNYDFVNEWGRTVWGKLVRTVFKEEHKKEFGVAHWARKTPTEAQISEIYVTTGRVEKTFAKMKADGPWRSNRIPELFGRVYHDIVTEEMWEIIKKWKDPIINFRRLRSCIVNDVKKVKPEIF